jgi:AraC-like DNA-binding protein
MDFEPTLSPRFVAYVRDYLLDREVDPDLVFSKCGIPSKNSEDYDVPIPVHQIALVLELAAEVTDNPRMGMNMGQQYHYEAGSLLIMAVLAAPNVAAGLKCLNQYDKYVDTGITTTFNFDSATAQFSSDIIAPESVKLDQLNEYLITFLVRTLNIATRKNMPLQQVSLRHKSDRNVKALEAFFDAPVKFSQTSNKLYFDRDYLQQRFLSSNSLLFDVLTNALDTYFSPSAETSDFVDRVSREIIRCGPDESPTAENIAQRLAISPRTLRRRLADEEHSFQGAKNLAREKRAKYYLGHTNMSLSEISFELGYSEMSAFSRAFRTWRGVTPQAYRDGVKKLFQA